jgi:hypothetical protein
MEQEQIQTNNISLNTMPPKTWMVESILVTILCCLPFGIAGIVNASKVESLHKAGDTEGALRASNEAKKWLKIGVIISAIGLVLYLIFIFFIMNKVADNPEFIKALENK